MLSSITPLGERGRNRSWGVTVTAYVVGSVVGGIATGVVVGTLGSLIPDGVRPGNGVIGWGLAGLLALAAAHELGYFRIELPTLQRQVNEGWLDEYRGWVVGAGFGFQLGAGLSTIVTSAGLYLVWVTAALTFSPAAGALIGASFGLARSLPVLTTRTVTNPQRLRAWHAAMERLGGPASTATAVVSLLLAVTMGVTSGLGVSG